MDVIIEDNVLFRFKKKWVNRYCKLVRTNNFSDSVKLLVLAEDKSKNKRSSFLVSKHVVYGHLHGIHMNNESHVMFVVCKNSVECLAFKEFNLMKSWSDHIKKHLNDISQPAALLCSDKGNQMKTKLEGRLLINCSHISFIRDPSCVEPKLLMSWKISDIIEYGCSKEMRKNSSKSRQTTSFDLPQNVFFIKSFQPGQKAPNSHFFNCHSPKQFCDRLELISSNQENFHSPNESCMVMQRFRTESFHTVRNNFASSTFSAFDMELNPDSPVSSSSNFMFPETPNSRIPRFQRSVSEAPRTRSRIDSGNSINEESELDFADRIDSSLCKAGDVSIDNSDMETPTRSATFTWLERYPYEREPMRTPHRRLVSEASHESYRIRFNSNLWSSDQTPFRPKSSSNYCSLINLRPRSKISLDLSSSPSSPPPLPSLPTTATTASSQINLENPLFTAKEFQLNMDKNQGLISRRFKNQNNVCEEMTVMEKSPNSSAYVNLEFTEIVEQINQLCDDQVDNSNKREENLKRLLLS